MTRSVAVPSLRCLPSLSLSLSLSPTHTHTHLPISPIMSSSSTERSPLLPTHAPSAGQLQSTAQDATASARHTAFQLAPALAALQAGKLPSQAQLSKLLDAALASDVLNPGIGRAGSRTGRLSEEGARVVRAFRAVLEAAGKLGDEKNGAWPSRLLLLLLSSSFPSQASRSSSSSAFSPSCAPRCAAVPLVPPSLPSPSPPPSHLAPGS